MNSFLGSIIFISFGIILTLSCNSTENSSDNDFKFEIEGNAKNADGLVLALYIPSKDLDQRITSKIQDGRYHFAGVADNIEMAEIRFEENIISGSQRFSTSPVVVEPGLIEINFEIKGEPMLYFLDDIEVIRGQHNKFLFTNGPRFQEAMSTWIFSDSIKMDSMNRYVYPNVREKTLTMYDSICGSSSSNPLCLFFLHGIVEGFDSPGAFDRKFLPNSDFLRIREFFAEFDTSLVKNKDYKFIKTTLMVSDQLLEGPKFVDFELVNLSGEQLLLSDICKQNRLTIIDFWWSGCVPCRKFNRENSNYYHKLKTKGIEIVGINVDESRSRWMKSSEEDEIGWVNLYAGKMTDIEAAYRVRSFPTKLIYNSDLDNVTINFQDLKDFEIKLESDEGYGH